MTTNNHQQATQRLRNRAITQALEAALQLADPGYTDVRIWPNLAEDEEHRRRTELAPYISSWIVGPLVDALRTSNLAQYAGPGSGSGHADRLMRRMDETDTERSLRDQIGG